MLYTGHHILEFRLGGTLVFRAALGWRRWLWPSQKEEKLRRPQMEGEETIVHRIDYQIPVTTYTAFILLS